jgi:hypothetical protein
MFSQIGWVEAKVQIENLIHSSRLPLNLLKPSDTTSLILRTFYKYLIVNEQQVWRAEPGVSRLNGADRDRTDGLLNANQALSQLSYSP